MVHSAGSAIFHGSGMEIYKWVEVDPGSRGELGGQAPLTHRWGHEKSCDRSNIQ